MAAHREVFSSPNRISWKPKKGWKMALGNTVWVGIRSRFSSLRFSLVSVLLGLIDVFLIDLEYLYDRSICSACDYVARKGYGQCEDGSSYDACQDKRLPDLLPESIFSCKYLFKFVLIP